jgi:tetratricopeptide (TPR) repeat protein
LALTAVAGIAFLALQGQDSARLQEDKLWRHRNLGKAFYENPTTQTQAVAEFKAALDLAPNSARERLNYGLALLRAGKTEEGAAEIAKAQEQDPKIPHTWFNLGIVYKKESENEKAIAQLERMAQLAPDEPKTHYNLGVLYKLTGKTAEAIKEFENASRLDPNLAGPHFQLYNAYRQGGRTDDAARELKVFTEIKERTKGAVIPEDMEWSFYSEIYETVEPNRPISPRRN